MRITKYNHACLLVEDNDINTLIDPGNYSEEVLDVTKIPPLSYLVITHVHQDHFYLSLVKKLVALFPDMRIITTPEIVTQLEKENIPATEKGNEYIAVEQVPHEKVWGMQQTQNIMVTVGGRLAHPGDSHTFRTTAEILALPFAAPWGSTTRAIEIVEELRPKIVIPIHDFMLKDTSRQGMYQWVDAYLRPQGIDFKKIETAEPIEV